MCLNRLQVEEGPRQARAPVLRHGRKVDRGRGARDQRREVNDAGNTERPRRNYKSD